MTLLSDRIRKLAARANGMHATELPSVPTYKVSHCAYKMAQKGKLFQVKLSHNHARYFTDPLLADALRERVRVAGATARSYNSDHTWRAPWPEDAEAFVPEHVTKQIGPYHPPRFQEHTHSFIHGGLRCA